MAGLCCHPEDIFVITSHLEAIDQPVDTWVVIATIYYLRTGAWALGYDAYVGYCAQKRVAFVGMTTYKNAVRDFLLSKTPLLAAQFLEATSEWLRPALEHPNNDTQGILPGCRFCVDTVPCHVENINNSNVCYNAKYADNVVKKLAFYTFNGFFIEFPSRTLYTGTSADNVILDHASNMHDFLQERDLVLLADGGFQASARVVIPFSKDEIWPDPAPHTRALLEKYREAAHEKLERNARLCFWRARVEHAFGESQLGKFKLLQRYSGRSYDVLLGAFLFGECLLNIEAVVKHGYAGRYPARVVGAEDYGKSLVAQNDRYPEQATRRRQRPGNRNTSDIVERGQPTLDMFLQPVATQPS